MPSALETLVKILKLEREKSFQNTAVSGGLSAYSANWSAQAHGQARKPEHHALVDEISGIMLRYDSIEDPDQRRSSVEYMLGRITGRVPAPPEAAARVAEWAARLPAQSSPPTEDAQRDEQAPAERPEKRERRERPPREAGPAPAAQQQSARPPRPQQDNPRGQQQQRPRPQQGKPGGRSGGEGGEEREGGGEFSSLDVMEFRSGTPGRLDIPVRPKLTRPPRQPRRALSEAEAADLLRGLASSVEVVRGIGPAKVEQLNRLGIFTIGDMLTFLPRRYDDYTQISLISRLQADQIATVIGTVRHAEVRVAQRGRKDFFMTVDDGSATLNVMFFSQHYLISSLRPGTQVVLHGPTGQFRERIQMTNPEWDVLDVDDLQAIGIVPVYPLTEGLNGKSMRKLMKRAVEYWAEQVPDYVPEATLERAELADLGWAYRNLHFPESFDHLEHAQRRYVFDQLLLMQLAILDSRRVWQSAPAHALPIDEGDLAALTSALFPYALTGAQQRVITEIRADIGSTRPMNRLLQGDVGSGKTAVAATALAIASLNGRQSVIMAPTGILAEQHFRSIGQSLANIPGPQKPEVALLTSALPAAQRADVLQRLAEGSIHVLVGTHALLEDDVVFRDLALAIIDEQHRFGVEQRGKLRAKGGNPHLLVMTATPIPRTLALTLYADLDLSVIDEMPPGRVPVRTKVVEPAAMERIHDFVKSRVDAGEQAFIVYPLVEASESIEAEAALEAYERLRQVYYRYRVGLLHGRMKPAEKDAVMTAFRERQYDVLVTTSVAEVGVDIPNASVVVINNASRFGLASLHQFRGRVGRGGLESFCFLINDSTDQTARDRLKAMELTNDGFRLAEIDWKLRGPGDLVGTRQSGQPVFKLMEAMNPLLVELAQREARTIYAEDPLLALPHHHLLAQRVQMLRDERADLS